MRRAVALVQSEVKRGARDISAAARVFVAPPLASPHVISCQPIPLREVSSFEILLSAVASEANIHIPPDNYLCDDCRREMLDPNDRRYRYPFINCTNCGPRYSIVRGVPYDRPLTTMSCFPMCETCERAYPDPRDRRFHAHPVASSECGQRVLRRDARRPDSTATGGSMGSR